MPVLSNELHSRRYRDADLALWSLVPSFFTKTVVPSIFTAPNSPDTSLWIPGAVRRTEPRCLLPGCRLYCSSCSPEPHLLRARHGVQPPVCHFSSDCRLLTKASSASATSGPSGNSGVFPCWLPASFSWAGFTASVSWSRLPPGDLPRCRGACCCPAIAWHWKPKWQMFWVVSAPVATSCTR